MCGSYFLAMAAANSACVLPADVFSSRARVAWAPWPCPGACPLATRPQARGRCRPPVCPADLSSYLSLPGRDRSGARSATATGACGYYGLHPLAPPARHLMNTFIHDCSKMASTLLMHRPTVSPASWTYGKVPLAFVAALVASAPTAEFQAAHDETVWWVGLLPLCHRGWW